MVAQPGGNDQLLGADYHLVIPSRHHRLHKAELPDGHLGNNYLLGLRHLALFLLITLLSGAFTMSAYWSVFPIGSPSTVVAVVG
jgi:hypothetical protein